MARDLPPITPPARRSSGPLALKIMIGVLVVALVGVVGTVTLLLAKGGPSGGATQAAAPTAIPAAATATTAPQATATATQSATTGCGANGGAPLSLQQLGILDFSPQHTLPDNLPQKPQALTNQLATTGTAVTSGNTIQVDAQFNQPSGTDVAVVCQVSVRLDSFQPFAQPIINIWGHCNGYYMNPGGFAGAGCGGGTDSDGGASVVFTTAKAGTTVVAPVTGGGSNQPAQISATSPGILIFSVQVSQPGVYTFSFGLWQDRSGPKYLSQTIHQTILVGQASHVWGGQQCSDPAMLSQLPPPSNPPGQFICPGGPPQS